MMVTFQPRAEEPIKYGFRCF